MNNKAALLFGRDDGHLDHIAPFCSLFEIPLFFTEKFLYDAAISAYPGIMATLDSEDKVTHHILKSFDILISTLPKQILNQLFFYDELTLQKKIKSYWLPHGASDKKNLHALIKEDHILIYGDKMLGMLPKTLREKTEIIGNYRYKYYQINKDFYTKNIKKLFPALFERESILYAPSWESSTIGTWTHTLIEKKPKDLNLFIKLHPNTYAAPIGDVLMEKYKDYNGIYFIKDFFPIYPLIAEISKLYTDISSIGHDFLTFNRPILFTSEKKTPLHACGKIVTLENPYPIIDPSQYEFERISLYKKTFNT